MANYMIIIDGLGEDQSYSHRLNEKINSLPYFSQIISHSKQGVFDNSVVNMPIDSFTCISTLLGVDLSSINGGRAYFEALAENIPIENNDLILRCNLVTLEQEKLISTSGYKLSNEQIKVIFESVIKEINCEEIKIYYVGDYKGIVVLKNSKLLKDSLKLFPPHQNIGKNFDELLPLGNTIATKLLDIIKLSRKISDKEMGKLKYDYCLSFWGASYKTKFPKFSELSDKKTALIVGTQIAKGIGKALCLDVLTDETMTGDSNTSLENKANYAVSNKNNYENIIVHINATDEIAHRRNFDEKLEFLEKIDDLLIRKIIENIDDSDKILICSYHGTSSATGAHIEDYPPFWLYKKGGQKVCLNKVLSGINAIKLLNECEE
ncbi:MAG: hypothetical protein RR806_07200 [Oscillospiraceae bacterium]